MIIKPNRLVKGDVIQIVSPGYPVLGAFPARTERATRQLESLGFEVRFGKNSFLTDGHIGGVAGTAKERAEDINAAFQDKDVSAILCSLGGADTFDILPYLDYELISNNPKVICGHSSNMTILNAITAKAKISTYHGPCFFNNFGEFPEPLLVTVQEFLKTCSSGNAIEYRPMAERTDQMHSWWYDDSDNIARKFNLPGGWKFLKQGKGQGPLIGGALFPLLALIDTPWEPCFDDAILFFDVDQTQDPAITDAGLGELNRRTDILNRVSGIIIGVPSRYHSPPYLASLEDVILKWVGEFDGPVLFDADCGHTDPTWTLAIGATAYLNSEDDSFCSDPGCNG